MTSRCPQLTKDVALDLDAVGTSVAASISSLGGCHAYLVGDALMADHFDGFGRGVLAGIVAIGLAMVAPPAKTHTHTDHDQTVVSWYPVECCDDGDCRPVASIKLEPHGLFMTTVDGHTALVDNAHPRRASRDMRWHICIGEDLPEETAPRVRCVFEPPNS